MLEALCNGGSGVAYSRIDILDTFLFVPKAIETERGGPFRVFTACWTCQDHREPTMCSTVSSSAIENVPSAGVTLPRCW